MRRWMYNEDGGKIFEEGEDIPKGYVDCPSKVEKSKDTTIDRAALKDEAEELGLEFAKNIKSDKLQALVNEAKADKE